MRDDPAFNPTVPFGKVPGVHFARFLILDEVPQDQVKDGGQTLPAQLIFLADVDAPLDDRINELITVAGRGLDTIYQHCEGYPNAGSASRREQLAYLRAHMSGYAALYVNTVGLGLRQIKQEVELRDAIERFLDTRDWRGSTPTETRTAIQEFVRGEPALGWALLPSEAPDLAFVLRDLADLAAVPIALLLGSPALLAILPLWAAVLRAREKTDAAPLLRADDARIQLLAAPEDRIVQNQFSAAGFLKPGWFRRITASFVLFLVNWGVRHIFNHANLAGVKTIHFARWIFIDGKRRLVFASNYDGSLESYMDDFIDKVAWGLNAVFSNGIDYPRTSWLVKDGAHDELAFKYFIRSHQMETQLWYSAYPELTAINIENNAQIRAGLFKPMNEIETEAWLQRF